MALFQEHASSGLTIKAWCAQNNISIHTYNYWKHILKQEYVESSLSGEHDIVPLNIPATALSIPTTPVLPPLSGKSRDSRELHNTISITIGDISIHADCDISDEYLLRIIKAVRHA